MEAEDLYHQLRKLSASPQSEETLGQVLEKLWSTRKKGLAPHQKLEVQSLLNLPSFHDLDPVLACLRSIIRNTLHENLSEDVIRELCPLDVSVDFQRTLVSSLKKYQNQWKEEASRDQPVCQRIRVSNQVEVNPPVGLKSFPASDSRCSSVMMWSRQDSSVFQHNCSNLQGQMDHCYYSNQNAIPHLKSMTWTLDNRNSVPSNWNVIVSLKVQDTTESFSGETEIKFCLSKDTLEAMLRSMTYISEQFANKAAPASTAKNQEQ